MVLDGRMNQSILVGQKNVTKRVQARALRVACCMLRTV
jgi:hypothetical protein